MQVIDGDALFRSVAGHSKQAVAYSAATCVTTPVEKRKLFADLEMSPTYDADDLALDDDLLADLELVG